ncbi:protease complex subunit PrcB family protein [Allohahella sp. A8]|uniref:protease complex subunit PrcB family protein n=1 Tax=Allohahella sp. A8 TaxID=3141461 RepID=UPI003A80827E
MKAGSGVRMAVAAAVACITLAIQGCADDSKAAETTDFTRISSGSYSGIQTKTLTIYDNQADFEAAYYADTDLTLPAPIIDFQQTLVIGVFMGEQPILSNSISVESVVTDDEKIVVQVKSLELADGCISQPAVGYPYELVSIARPTGKQILFVESLGSKPCTSG